MVDRSDSIMIDRPVEEVFAYVADVTNDPAWHTDILEARKTTRRSGRVGHRLAHAIQAIDGHLGSGH
jgi:hypothetical protein